MSLSQAEGELLVRIARRAVEKYLAEFAELKPPEDSPQKLREKRGVFVTLEKLVLAEGGMRRRVLRGCIGFPEPIYPLIVGTIKAAIEAAMRDPRFPPVREEELDEIVFEVSVLTKPVLVEVQKPGEYPTKIKVGYDGLIVERGFFRGLLLPQVAVEYGWSEEEFLSQTCVKAGLPPDAWKLPGTKVYKFQAQIFAELEPRGEIIERKIHLGVEEE